MLGLNKVRWILFVFLIAQYTSFAQNYLNYYFKSNDIDGAIVIFNKNTNQWIFSNDSEPFLNTPFGSHFHLLQALEGLETDVFNTSAQYFEPWYGVKRSFFGVPKTEWTKENNVKDALKYKNDWYFNLLAYRLPEEIYQEKIKSSSLIKETLNNNFEYFWNYGVLTNPNTMINFLKDLYENRLPYKEINQQFVFNELMINNQLAIHESITHYQGKKITWMIGVYLKHSKPVYFSLRTSQSLESPELPNFNERKNLVLSQIFESLNL